MHRRTKIIATLGPASSTPALIKDLIQAGIDLFRINFSHARSDDYKIWVETIRHISKAIGKEVGILGDLQGPKIRIRSFQEGSIVLKEGDHFILDAELSEHAGTSKKVGLTYKTLPQEVGRGDSLLVSDGRIELLVQKVKGKQIICKVSMGGILASRQGIHKKGGGVHVAPLTAEDKRNIHLAAHLSFDYLALSFPRSAQDLIKARKIMTVAQCSSALIAKVERQEALNSLDELIEASDGVMVARGDLGVEIGDAELPAVQKRIIHRARHFDRTVIIATQMMESMIENTTPTRAEVFDVANAAAEGVDAVLLSAETAVGKHPVKVIEAVHRICLGAERERATQVSSHRLEKTFVRIDQTIAMAAMYAANHASIKAIVTFTESGATPLLMSRINSPVPIFGFTRDLATVRKMTLYRDVIPIHLDFTHYNAVQLGERAIHELVKRKVVQMGDWIILTRGDIVGIHGGTNRIKIVRVGDALGA
ncbi:MAG: pyruvate kinase [Gammaproteobacteria bacterium]|nr:pyruvate kinase [Gammaproteobacteria bacterium]